MVIIKRSIEINKKMLLLLVLVLVVIGTVLFKYYAQQKRDNRALRIKILSMQENKRTPKPWVELLKKAAAPEAMPAATVETPIDSPVAIDDTQELAVKLNIQMRRVKNLDEANLDSNIAMADEIISREPDSYVAYKAKLISLLTKEGKFKLSVDETEVSDLLENMAQFNLSSDKLARREALLVGNTNSDIQNIESQLDMVSRQRDLLEAELSNLDPNSAALASLNAELQQLDEQEMQLVSSIEMLEDQLANNRSQLQNEDIVEISFMRMLAQDDTNGVINNAQAFIAEYPASPSGYFYMIRALELQGQKEQALEVIQNTRLPLDAQQALIQRLETESSEDPKNYWQNLSF